MASVPACLLLSTSLRLPLRRTSGQQQPGRQQWRRPAAVASGAPAPTTGTPRERKKDGLPQDAIKAFDAKLWAGDLEGCLAVLRREAAAASGPPRPLLGPERNRSLIQACFARRRPAAAIAYLQLLHPDVADYAAVLKEAGKRRDVDTLRRVLAARSDAGLSPDHRTTTAAIAGYAASGRLPDALAVFCRAWERPECRTVEVVNAAISACANHGNWEAAQEVVVIMEQEGIAPDVITYNSLLKAAAARGLLGDARRLYAELLQAGLAPSTFTYAALFSAAARARSSDAAWLLQMFDEMQQLRVQPNNHVVSALFAAASFAPCSPAQLERLFAALALLRSFGPPNDTVYSALFTLIQRQGIQERTVDVWGALQADGVRLSPHLFSSLFAACTAEQASSALVEVAMNAADAMHAAWRAQVQRPNRRVSEDRDMLVAYNALLHFLGTAGELQRALKVYQSMAAGGPWPDVVSYNTLIAAAASGGNVKVAMRIFSDMVDAEVEPTERTVGALLNCYAKARDAASARKVFDSMRELGIPANVKIYTSLIDACVQARGDEWTELAFDLLDRMRADGLAPTAVTYGCLLSACARRGDVGRAFLLYKQACDEGVVPSDQMHDMLISMCTQEQRLEEAVDLVKRLARRQPSPASASAALAAAAGAAAGSGAGTPVVAPAAAAAAAGGGSPPSSPRANSGSGTSSASASGLQEHTLNSLIRALCGKYPDRALRLLSLCQTMGMRTSRRTYLALITGCARASRSAAAYDLYRSLRAQGMDADSPTGSALIISLCQANQEEVAETVYNDMLALAWRRQRGHLPAPAACRGGLSNTAQLPDTEAMACLVQAFAAAGQMRSAAKFYKQLRRSGPKSLAGVTMSHRRMWELLIESYCRQGSVKQALQVFDDWKAAADAWAAAQQQHLPNLDSLASQELEEEEAQQAQQAQQEEQQRTGPQEHDAPLAAEAAVEQLPVVQAAGLDGNGAAPKPEAPAAAVAAIAADEPAPKAAAARAARAARAAAAAKLAGAAAPAAAAGAAAPFRSYPKLSYVTLAFLEACCRRETEFEWRVYDVCAVMRQQKETKRQAGLARPQKASHHFAPA